MRRWPEFCERTAASDGDLIFFGADTGKVVSDALGALRLKVGQDLKLAASGWRPLWVVDFPMFEWDAGGQALGSHASSVHQSGEPGLRRARGKSRRGDRQGLRPGAQRLGDRRRLGAYSHAGAAVRRVRPVGHLARGGAASSSASCSMRSSSVRRPTAASRSVWIGWRC